MQALAFGFLVDCLTFRKYKSSSFLEQAGGHFFLLDVALLEAPEFDVAGAACEEAGRVGLELVYPLDVSDLFRHLAGVQHVEGLLVGNDFGQVVEVVLSLLVLDALKDDDSAAAVANGEVLAMAVERHC